MEIVPFEGWQRCAKLSVGNTELIVTLEVGPRVMFYGLKGGVNELYVNPKFAGASGAAEYTSYGGHRLWIAPEDWERTYQAENDAVEYNEVDGVHVFTAKPDQWGMQKEIRVKADEANSRFELVHCVTNRCAYEVEFALWCLSQMAAGGTCLFPQAPFVPHTENFLPVRPMVMWGYTKMTDPRWTWGDQVVRLQNDATSNPQKVGMQVAQGYAAYANHGNLFLKRFPFEAGANYTDYGCNFETYTNGEMLEVESLGPLTRVGPGETATYREAWYLIPNATPPAGDAECAAWLKGLADSRPL
jgi:hypothetical protein